MDRDQLAKLLSPGGVTFDVSTLTLGEAAAAERAAGVASVSELLRSRTSLRLLAVFVHLSRTYGATPSWSELANLRIADVLPSTSPSSPDGASEISSDSPSETSAISPAS